MSQQNEPADLVTMAVGITAAYVASNRVRDDEVPAVLAATYAALTALNAPFSEAASAAEHVPAVTPRKSLASREHILSMIDGKPYRTLTRHITRHGLTPDQYRERYGLKSDYPMVAPAYSEVRSAAAKAGGFGRKAVAVVETAVEVVADIVSNTGKPKSVSAAKAAARKHLGG